MANRSSSFALLLYCLSATASAGDWKFTPAVTVNERFSDNVSLSTVSPESSFMTEITPGFKLSSKGGKGSFSVDYGLQALIYSHDGDANSINNQLSATLKSELINERIFLDASARIGQQNTNLTGVAGTGNYNTTGNRTETRSASITPSLRERFGNNAQLDARWQLTYSDSNNAVLSGTTGSSLNLNLSSGSAFKNVPWSLAYRLQSNDGNASATRNSSLSGSLGYIYSPRTRLTLSVGNDSNNGSTAGFNRAGGMYWNMGLNWKASNRTDMGMTVGHRYGGNSYGLNFSHRTRKSTWAIRYSEDISDTFSQISSTGAFDIYLCGTSIAVVPTGSGSPDTALCGADPIIPAQILNSTQLVNDTSLNKSWNGLATYNTGKSTLIANLNMSRRTLLTAGTSDENYSLGGTWTSRLNPRLTSALSVVSSHAKTVATQSDDWSIAWILSQRLTRQATGVLEIRHLERESGSTTGAYKENSVSARVNMSF